MRLETHFTSYPSCLQWTRRDVCQRLKTWGAAAIPRASSPSRHLCMSLYNHSHCLQTSGPCRCAPWLAELQSPLLTGIGSVLCRIQCPGEMKLGCNSQTKVHLPFQNREEDQAWEGLGQGIQKAFLLGQPFPWALDPPPASSPLASQRSFISSASQATRAQTHVRILEC